MFTDNTAFGCQIDVFWLDCFKKKLSVDSFKVFFFKGFSKVFEIFECSQLQPLRELSQLLRTCCGWPVAFF